VSNKSNLIALDGQVYQSVTDRIAIVFSVLTISDFIVRNNLVTNSQVATYITKHK